MSVRHFFAVIASGVLFGFGLALSTMVSPEVVLSFLRFQDFGLMLVMGGGVLVTLLTYQWAPKLLKRPLMGQQFSVRSTAWDRDTQTGAAIFGIGWGLCGVCPGPAIAALGVGGWEIGVALAGIAIGAYAQGWLKDHSALAATPAS